MNNTLIDQLKLAIQVESGEVPLSEVTRRLRPEYISKDVTQYDWQSLSDRHKPSTWNHEEYEYRRKPKPLECWVNTYTDGSSSSFERKCDAVDSADEDHNRCVIERVAVHMREVSQQIGVGELMEKIDPANPP